MSTPLSPPSPPSPPPISRERIVDRYFMEHRAKLLDLTAFLDRVERATPGDAEQPDDPRMEALRRALRLLDDGKPERARRVLQLFSDPTADPIDHATTQGAIGVPPAASPEAPPEAQP